MAEKETVALTLRVPATLAKKIKKQAEREGLTVNAFIISVMKMDNLLLSDREWKLEQKWQAEREQARRAELEQRVGKIEAELRGAAK